MPDADAAQLIDRNASKIRIAVNADGEALVTYRTGSRWRRVVARGAINARSPSLSYRQVRFQLDYTGRSWSPARNVCAPYKGPNLFALVAACTAPDGSFWALQSWRQPLPNLGFTPWLASQRATWLELSHWSGPLPRLAVDWGWIMGHRSAQLFGTFTYRGIPVHGFGTTRFGRPTDSFGRLIYLDSYDSAYGPGWRRENSFVSRRPHGHFCYGFVRRNATTGGYIAPPGWNPSELRGPGLGVRERLIADGPGVTPLVKWQGDAYHAYDDRDPSDSIRDVRQTRRIESYGSGPNSCFKNTAYQGIARPPADAFQSRDLSELWRRPTTTGGASISTGKRGLVIGLPAGRATASIFTARAWHTRSPVWIEIGPDGVPDEASLTFGFRPAHYESDHRTPLRAHVLLGARIAGGQFYVLTRKIGANGGLRDIVSHAVPYDPTAMRVVYARIRRSPTSRTEFFTAPSLSGPWELRATIRNPFPLATAVLGLVAEGEGLAATAVNVEGLTQ